MIWCQQCGHDVQRRRPAIYRVKKLRLRNPGGNPPMYSEWVDKTFTREVCGRHLTWAVTPQG